MTAESPKELTIPERAVLVAAEVGGSLELENANALGVNELGLRKLVDLGALKEGADQWRITEHGKELASLYCPRCFSPLGKGVAFYSWLLLSGATFEGEAPARLGPVAKCHACGHSETIR